MNLICWPLTFLRCRGLLCERFWLTHNWWPFVHKSFHKAPGYHFPTVVVFRLFIRGWPPKLVSLAIYWPKDGWFCWFGRVWKPNKTFITNKQRVFCAHRKKITQIYPLCSAQPRPLPPTQLSMFYVQSYRCLGAQVGWRRRRRLILWLFDHKYPESCLCNFYSPYSVFVQVGRSYRVEGWMVVNIVGPTMLLCVLIVCSYFLLFI